MMQSNALAIAKWTATAAGIAGAILVALNVELVACGFGLFLASSVLWCAATLAEREPSLVVLQSAFVAINVFGLWRWLGS